MQMPATRLVVVLSETERSAGVKDDDAESDQDEGEQHMLPAFEDLVDPGSSRNELGQHDQSCNKDEEDNAARNRGSDAHAEEDRHVATDVVPTVGDRPASPRPTRPRLPGDHRV